MAARATRITLRLNYDIDSRRHFAAYAVIALTMAVLGWLAICSGRAVDERERLASQEAFSAYRSAASEASR